MIHIVFQEADVEVLRQAIQLDASLNGEVIQIKDDFAVGPLKNIYTEEGINARRDWWRMVISGSDIDGKVDDGTIDDARTVADVKERLQNDPAELLWIWAAQNKHDVSGYYWLMSQ